MSGKTTVGTDVDGPGREQRTNDSALRTLVTDALAGVEPVEIVYRENTGSLDAPEETWHRYESLADLPDRSVDGWDELYVYTETHVYRWLGVGFANGPQRLPRDPSSLPAGD